MGSKGATENVVSGADIGDPVAHGLVDGFFKRGLAGGDGDDFGAQESHAGHVQGLSFHVDLAHVDSALQTEAGADGRGGDAVLAGAGFGDDAFFAESFGEEGLTEGVVDFVSAGVE